MKYFSLIFIFVLELTDFWSNLYYCFPPTYFGFKLLFYLFLQYEFTDLKHFFFGNKGHQWGNFALNLL